MKKVLSVLLIITSIFTLTLPLSGSANTCPCANRPKNLPICILEPTADTKWNNVEDFLKSLTTEQKNKIKDALNIKESVDSPSFFGKIYSCLEKFITLGYKSAKFGSHLIILASSIVMFADLYLGFRNSIDTQMRNLILGLFGV